MMKIIVSYSIAFVFFLNKQTSNSSIKKTNVMPSKPISIHIQQLRNFLHSFHNRTPVMLQQISDHFTQESLLWIIHTMR